MKKWIALEFILCICNAIVCVTRYRQGDYAEACISAVLAGATFSAGLYLTKEYLEK